MGRTLPVTAFISHTAAAIGLACRVTVGCPRGTTPLQPPAAEPTPLRDLTCLRGRRELEPVEAVARQRQQVGQLADRREDHASHALDWRDALEPPQVKLDRLRA